MSTKWVTPLFLSVLSFMVNTQNVCAMSKQGQGQSSSEAFQTNHATKTIPNKSLYKDNQVVIHPIDSLEDLMSKWDTLLSEVQHQEGANNEDFQLFSNFNRSYLDSEWSALFQLVKYRKINYGNISFYLAPKKQKLQSLYTSFLQIKQNYPSSVEPFRHPSVVPPLPVGCNAACTNMDFSTGDFTGWNGYYAKNNSTTLAHVISGVTGGVLGAVVRGARDPATSNTFQAHITSAGNNDWFLSNYHSINMSQSSPWGTGHSAMIGDSINNGKGVAILSQEFQVTPTTNSITYAYSVFMENPAHNYFQQPFFSVVLFDQNGDTIKNCGVYNVVSGSNIPGFTGEYYPPDNRETSGGAGGDTIYWRPWTQVNVPLNNYVGQCVTIQFEVGDCALGGHCGYAYVDASCSTFTITAATPDICQNGTDVLTGPAGESHYSWTGPANSILTNDTLQNITIDSAGTYTLVITPVTGGLCKDTLTISIGKDQLTATATSTNINCGLGTGTATANAVNGLAPYVYLWSPSAQTNAIATGLSAGTYTVTVSDANGCAATASATITEAPLLTVSAVTLSNITCNGGTNGSANAAASGGTSPYNYLWNPSAQTNANATGLSAGTYTVFVTDANGCRATATTTITQPPALTASTSILGNVNCNGGSNGSASVTAANGTGPYNYLWNPSAQTNPTATGLSAGTYTVTVTDANGCTATATATITQPLLALSASTNIVSNVNCNGGSNGSASVTAAGGTNPYNYLWNPSAQTNATATGLSAGTYTITVTDANGCTATATATITQPLIALSASTNVVSNVNCNGGNNGSASVTAAGGTNPYNYLWNPSAQTNATATGLSAGTYTVTVTDANGCTATATVSIIQPSVVLSAFTSIVSNVSCNGGSNGSASVIAAGGTNPYNYLWNPSAQTNTIATGLSAGTYTVTVTDANGCTATATATVTQPLLALSASTNIVSNVNCNGGSNGSASVTTAGGTNPYNYLWNPSAQTNATATGLSAGTYTVTATDAHGCSATVTATITQPLLALSASTNIVGNVSCNGGSNGSASVTTAGGTNPYNYLWNPSAQTNATATGLSAGTYTVTVTDAHGCNTTATATITQPLLALSASINILGNVSCNGGSNGSASVTAAGGTGPYNYLWNPSAQTNATATGLSAGTYTVTVTDAHGCNTTATVTITQPLLALSASTSIVGNVSCNGGSDGSASVTAAGGTNPYNYLWNPSAQTNTTATGLSAGTYTVTVTDAHGCNTTATATITQPLLALSASTLITGNVSCNGGSNGSASVTTAGGASPYNYLWNPSAQTNTTATGLSAGTYTVTVTDAHGCNTTATATITQPLLALSASTLITGNVSCNGGSNGSASVTANGGTSPYNYLWNPSAQTNTTATGLSAGTYTVTVTDAHGCNTTATATITQPLLALSASTLITGNVSCNGGSNGSASVTANGGTSPYNYLWNPSAQTNTTATGLSAGTYTVTVTDAHGCNTTATATITQPLLALSASTLITGNVSCNGGSNGSASVTANGGTSPYNYLWNPSAQTNTTATGLSAGTYTVTVTDAHGCIATATATINQPLPLTALTRATSNVNCNGNSNGSANVTASGGTLPYNYLWSASGQTNVTATGLSAGIYTVTVTDGHGCTVLQTITITQPAVLLASVTGSLKPLCKGQPATIDAVGSGGTAPYNYLWSTGSTNSSITITPLTTTIYTVTITDANGCFTTTSDTVIVAPYIVTAGQNKSICPGESTTLIVYPTGGDGQYFYTWLPGNNTTQLISVTPASTTTYTIIVTDGCNATDTVYETVVVNPLPVVSFGADIRRGCAPLCVQFENATSIGSGNIVQWDWDFGDGSYETSESAIHCYSKPGVYSVTLTATSNSGCSASATRTNYITAYPSPVAAFVANPQPTTILNPVIQFTNQTSNKDTIISWLWNFGEPDRDSNSSYISGDPIHKYDDTGVYRATLTIMNNHGCRDTVAHDVIIGPDFTLFFPNAFTPNGDGVNDYFFAKGSYVKDFEMYIFDRWGQKIFHTTDVNEHWDGRRAGGDMCQEDVYVYIATATDTRGNMYKYSGRVTLLK